MSNLLVFEAQGMLTNSLRQRVRIACDPSLYADVVDLASGGSDAWYALMQAVPAEVACSRDTKRIVEFVQDVLLSMSDELRDHVTGIRLDPHGLLDFLIREPVEPVILSPMHDVPRVILDAIVLEHVRPDDVIIINGVKHKYQPHPIS